jgi:hypothetical protein
MSIAHYKAVTDLLEMERQGKPMPPVDVALVLKTWELIPNNTNPFTVSEAVGPNAFVRACTLNDMLLAGSLAPWQGKGDRELEPFVFEEAATFPFGPTDNREEFLQRLKSR